MTELAEEKILIIGDAERQLQSVLNVAMPSAQLVNVDNYFDALIDLSETTYTAIFAAADPIERRPEPAIRNLRASAGEARLLLFGTSSYEPLSRKMLEFGLDDYLVTPTSPVELRQALGTPQLRMAGGTDVIRDIPTVQSRIDLLSGVSLAEVMLDAVTQSPHDCAQAAVTLINDRLGPSMQLSLGKGTAPVAVPDGHILLNQSLRDEQEMKMLFLVVPRDEDLTAARHLLAQLAHLLSKMIGLSDRHNRLQSLAITDDMTGLYNGRYFRVFLDKILKRARDRYFPVTLLLLSLIHILYSAESG